MHGTRQLMVWHKTRPRNEALDCKVYALAALRLAGIDLEARAKARAAGSKPKPAAQARESFVNRRTRGGWIKGFKP